MEFTTLELMNLESLVSARIFENNQMKRKQPNLAAIADESNGHYVPVAEKLRTEIEARFEAMKGSSGELFTLSSGR